MAVVRRARAKWEGNLSSGNGRVSADTSGAFPALPVSWAARTEAPNGRTSPEELLAAAHASCFAMAFSSELAKAGTPPDSLEVTSDVTFDRVNEKWTVVSSHLIVSGKVPNIDEARFRELADVAKSGCPISRALAGNVQISIEAKLAQTVG